MKKIVYIFLLLIANVFVSTKAICQVKTNFVRKYISTKKDSVLLDSLSIIPNTFNLNNVSKNFYKIDEVNAILYWNQKPLVDSVLISYRTFYNKLNYTSNLYNYDSIKNNMLVTPFFSKNNSTDSKLFDLGNMEYTGSFGRGLSFGNAQDAVVNSNLNLQLSGMLADSIEIAASLSDQNLPIQPDGSTTQLNEIDKIYIQFKKKNWNLNLGDIDLKQNYQYYLNFNKRIQGISFETTNKINNKIENNVIVSGAIAKGKFNTNNFQGLEGNQGPYRLKGANNEFFFIILGGSEKVYIDGELLQRGEDRDYIINYNTAEITFTTNTLITKDKRIRVEFEYSDRNYVNSQLYASDAIKINNKLKVRLSAYSNTDAKNSPINQTLNLQQKYFMASVGDSIQNAFFPTVLIDTLTAGKVLYKAYDTLVNAVYRRIYIYSSNPDSAKYNLSFTEMGQGKGNYIVLLNGVNGKVFKWIRPVGAIMQGNYEPVQFLVAPKKQQVFSISTEYTLSKNSSINWEMAMSNNNINTFSTLQKQNDKGFANKLSWLNNQKITKKIIAKSEVSYELNDANFRAIERLRTPEFNRDWNLPYYTPYYKEQLGKAQIQFTTNKNNSIQLQVQNYLKANGYKGYRQTITTAHQIFGWQLNSNISFTNTKDSFIGAKFIRPSIDLFKTFTNFKNYRIGMSYYAERNEFLQKVVDTLNANSLSFSAFKINLQSNLAKQNKWSLNYINRNNKVPIVNSLLLSDHSQDVEGNLLLTQNPNHLLNVKATYRNLNVVQPTKVNYKSDKTLLSRIEYTVNEWNGLLHGTTIYETGSGQEQKRDFAYLQVPTGQGEYYWVDYNNDGIQDLNEFEYAQFPDQRKFIKIFVPTNQFVKANFNNFNYSLQINPRTKMQKNNYKGIKFLISRSYFQSTLQIQKKEQSNSLINVNPLKFSTADTSLITLNRIFSNSYAFNKFSSNWGFDLNQDFRVSKSLLTYGYEGRNINSYNAKLRWNLNKKLMLETIAKKINSILITPAFNNRNYTILQNSLETRLSYTYNNKFRIQSSYVTERKENAIEYGGELAKNNSLIIEAKYNALQSASINGKFTLTNIKYTGTANNTVSYIMLDALVPGKNLLWNIEFAKTLKNNLEISFRYEGRKTGTAQTINIGSASMRANFY